MSQAVVFLARGIDGGLDAARAFLDSYRAHPAGRPHDLIVLTKGWETVGGRDALEQLVREAGGRTVDLPDDGFDWGAYMRIAPQLDHEWICFLNTHSRILADVWLDKLRTAAELPGVGAAGATGSWGTIAPVFRQIGPIVMDICRFRGWRDGVAACIYGYTVGYAYEVAKHVSQFPSFPNPHLRSNGFLMRRRSFQAFVQHVVVPCAKRDAFKLESGRSGLSRFVQMNGQRAVVVGRDGAVYEADEWGRSDTFRSPGHRNLLIADNQTSNYDMASVYSRRMMERSAWGQTFTDLSKGTAYECRCERT